MPDNQAVEGCPRQSCPWDTRGVRHGAGEPECDGFPELTLHLEGCLVARLLAERLREPG
jgi:hypothetical protein